MVVSQAVGGLPFGVGLDQYGSDQPQQRFRVGEHPDHIGATLHILVEPLERFVDPNLLSVRGQEAGKREQVLGGIAQRGLDLA
jgi:hypothetical protein